MKVFLDVRISPIPMAGLKYCQTVLNALSNWIQFVYQSNVLNNFGPHFKMIFVMLVAFNLICSSQPIFFEEQNQNVASYGSSESPPKRTAAYKSLLSNGSVAVNGYLDKLDNLERSVAAVLIKVAYGTTSTTKRSIPDNSYILGLTTVATPLLTTLRQVIKKIKKF